MKILNKIHLINWHYIPRATLPLNRHVNFFTGKTGAGKSTILDAIQLVMLGETRGDDYFNKAASGGSKRTLIEYLRGMNRASGEEKGYIRNHDFNSYIVIEFKEGTKHFCIGVLFTIYCATNQYDHIFFYLDDSLPGNGFIENGHPLTMEDFKKKYKGKADIYTSNKEYRDRFLYQHMGKLREEFFDAFRKSVPFTPPRTIREFYEKFICDSMEISIEDMRENVRLYRRLGDKLDNIKEQIFLLDNISKCFGDWKALCDEKGKLDFIVSKAEIEQLSLEIATTKTDIEKNNAKMTGLEYKITENGEAKYKLEKIRDELRDKIADSNDNKLYERLNNEIEDLQKKIEHASKLAERFRERGFNFSKWLDFINDFHDELPLDKVRMDFLCGNIKALEDCSFDRDGFIETNQELKSYRETNDSRYYGLKTEKESTEEEITRLTNEIEVLKRGKVYPAWLVAARDHLKANLGKTAVVNIFADTIEVKDLSWANAVEGYINSQKLNLIVSPEDYDKAVYLFEAMDDNKYNKVGIVNIKPIMDLRPAAKANSLAEEIDTTDKYSRVYADYLLGEVQKCSSVSELKNCKAAVTRNCHSYRGYVLTKLNPHSYTDNAYIGASSQRKQIALKKKQLEEQKAILESINTEYLLVSRYKDMKVYENNDIDALCEEKLEVENIPGWKQQYKDKCIERDKIDLSYVYKLMKEKEDTENKITALQKVIEDMRQEISDCRSLVKQLSDDIPLKEEDYGFKLEVYTKRYPAEWIEKIGMPFYAESVRMLNLPQIRIRFSNKSSELSERIKEAFSRVVDARQKAERKGVTGFDLVSESNEQYAKLLASYSEIALPEIQAKIKEQEGKAYEQLKEDLIYKLHDGIDKTIQQIEYLNKTLKKMDFGKDKYQLVVKGASKYMPIYNMLIDDMIYQPNSLLSASFEERHKDAIETLFNYIAESENPESKDSAQWEEERKNIIKFTDYRTFLDFDMTVKTEDIESDLSKTMSKNSGGETQMPFYISVLASFIQLYRMDKSESENTLRLVMFDEAFSKMDEEHITKCIDLIKQMKFQAIIVAPDDKIRSIGLLSDKLFLVQNENKKRINIFPFEKNEIDDLVSV